MNVNLKTILEQFQNVERSFPIPSNQSVKIKIRFQNIGKRERERDGDRLSISKLELERKVSHTLRTVAEAARDRRNDRVYRYEL